MLVSWLRREQLLQLKGLLQVRCGTRVGQVGRTALPQVAQSRAGLWGFCKSSEEVGRPEGQSHSQHLCVLVRGWCSRAADQQPGRKGEVCNERI